MALSEEQKQWALIFWQQGLSQMQIARRLNVHQTAISKLKKAENWELEGKSIALSYTDIINNGLRYIGRLQLELERGRFIEQGRPRIALKQDEVNDNIRNIKYTADMLVNIEKLSIETDLTKQMIDLEKHMEWLKAHYPQQLEALESAQEHFDELGKELSKL